MARGFVDIDIVKNRSYSDMTIIKRLLTYVKPFIKPLILSLLLVLIVVMVDLIGPLFVSSTLDALAETPVRFEKIVYIVVFYLASLIIGAFVSYKQTLLLQKTGQEIIHNIRRDVFNHIETLSVETFNHIPIGKLVTRVTSDVDTLNMLYTDVLINMLRNIVTIVGVFVIMFLNNWRLTLYISSVIPFVVLATFLFRKFSRKAYRRVRSNVSIINGFLSEHLSGMKLIQIFNREAQKYREFKKKNQDLNQSYLQQTLAFSLYRPLMYMLYVIALLIVLWFGSLHTLSGIISFGMLFAFTQYINKFFGPIQELAEKFDVLQAAFTAGERIFEIMDTKPLITDRPDAIELTRMKGKIEFRNVWFAYQEDDWILKDVSFVVWPKETLALVGATGSGKTTIISLIVRNYDIQKGQILIDDIDIRDIQVASLRKWIGQMLQDVFLFSGTIASNIRLRDEAISDEAIVESAQYVHAAAFIDKLPQRYDELVRERGKNFSSGQRQLLSFARAIVHQPSIMILDEATANIDTETEALIQKSLKKMMSIGTMIVVAHRLSTIQHSDRIVVMQKGRIIESGNHQELLKNRGHYYHLYRLQYDMHFQPGDVGES
ncbi:MAG: ABC transporter ATP-binding protein [Candidatus Izemoplasmatales bacterium]|nr:ABC transporter ATP-binding protein [Candidatus Izemoplasmatales bacterium]